MEISENQLSEAHMRAEKILNSRAEYLSQIFNKCLCKNKSYFQPLKNNPKKQLLRSKQLNPQAISQLIVQVTYLLYIGYLYKIPLQIQEVDIVINQKQLFLKQPMKIYILYKIQEKKAKSHLGVTIKKLIESILQKEYYFLDQKNTLIKTFRAQLGLIPLQNMESKQQTLFLKCLEFTQLFKVTSVLLKIKNISLINIIKNNKEAFSNLEERIKCQRQYIRQFMIETENKNETQIFNAQEKIYANIKAFFWEDLNELIVVDEDSQSINVDDTYGLRFIAIIHQDQYEFSNHIKNILGSNTFINENFEIQHYKQGTSEYFVQYSTYRDSLCVKLVSEIKLDVQVSDFLMFQTSNLSFDSVNITMELVQKFSGANAKSRFLTFKTHSAFTQKQAVIQKIILLMDILLVAQKVLQPYFSKSNKVMKDLFESHKLHKIVNHYVSIVLSIINKIYEKFYEK